MKAEPDATDGVVLTESQRRSRRRRSIALGLCIGGLVLLFYVITLVKMGPAILHRQL